MNDTPLVALRRQLLKREVDAHGNAAIARAAGKPDRQINDLIYGRTSFGDKIARQLEAIRPDLPSGWLVLGQTQTAQTIEDQQRGIEYLIAARAENQTRQTLKRANELLALWIELSDSRRDEIISQLRTELGKDNQDETARVIPARARTKPVAKIKAAGQ